MKALLKILILGVAACGFVNAAHAQFDGPTPLAWRWVASSVDYSPDNSPLIVGNTLYAAAGSRIYALDVASGNEKWKYPREGATGTFRPQPVLVGDTLVDVTDQGIFYGANIANGDHKWQYKMVRLTTQGQPVSVGKFVVFKQSDDTLMALDAETGKLAWDKSFPVETGFNGPLLVLGNDVIFANNNNEMLSVSAVSEKLNWKRGFGNITPGIMPSLYGENIYMYSGQFLVAVNALRGTGRWQVNLGQDMDYGPAVSGAGMACVTREGKVYFFDLNGHRALREVIDLGSGPACQPAAVGSKYLIPTINGALNLVDPKDGSVLWSYAVRPVVDVPQNKQDMPVYAAGTLIDNRILTVPAAGTPQLVGNTLLVTCEDASVLAFDPKLGVDLTPPDVDMLWPPPGAQTPGTPPLQLVFKVSDEATGVNNSTLKIDIDGTPVTYTATRDGVANVAISYEGNNKPLTDGRHSINVTVSDWMGNVAKKTYSIAIDNQLPPLAPPTGLQGNQGGGKNGGRGGKGGGGAGGGKGLGGGGGGG